MNANWKETIEAMVEEQNAYTSPYSRNPLDDILDDDWDDEDCMFDMDNDF